MEESFFEHLKEESLCHGASGIGEDIGVDEFGPPIPHLELMEIAAFSRYHHLVDLYSLAEPDGIVV